MLSVSLRYTDMWVTEQKVYPATYGHIGVCILLEVSEYRRKLNFIRHDLDKILVEYQIELPIGNEDIP